MSWEMHRIRTCSREHISKPSKQPSLYGELEARHSRTHLQHRSAGTLVQHHPRPWYETLPVPSWKSPALSVIPETLRTRRDAGEQLVARALGAGQSDPQKTLLHQPARVFPARRTVRNVSDVSALFSSLAWR